MNLTREQTIEGLESEWATFEEFLRGLSETDLQQPTRCEAWTVRDIAAHVVGGLADIAGGTVGTSSGQQQADERAERSSAELADEFHDAGEISMKLIRSLDDYLWRNPARLPASRSVRASKFCGSSRSSMKTTSVTPSECRIGTTRA